MAKLQLEQEKQAFKLNGRFLINLALIGVWVWLYSPLLDYFKIIFWREDFRTNQLILLGLLILTVQQIQKSATRIRLDALPKLRSLPLFLVISSSMGYLIIERFFDINTISATLFGFATYGLIGLWLSPKAWRSGFPVALLFIGTLPFGAHMQTFIGYPMRILTAELVQKGLLAFGVQSVGIDTILVFENGVSHIDLPCSGVNSLWTGSLFLLGATWLEKRPLNRYWFVVAIVFFGLLFLANLARVAILIVVGEVLAFPLLAEMLHVPLGVLGFVAACGTAVLLLRRQPITPENITIAENPSRPFTHKEISVLIAVLAIFALIYTPRPQTGLTQAAVSWTFPTALQIEPLPLTAVENEWLIKDGAESAERYRFAYNDLQGSMILISSKTWRAHHRPERCFEVYGLQLTETRTHLTSQQQPVRYVSLGNNELQNLYSATYWFQSTTQLTDDYGTRIWSDLAPERDRWVLVSIVFDETIDPAAAEVEAFYEMMQGVTAVFLADSAG